MPLRRQQLGGRLERGAVNHVRRVSGSFWDHVLVPPATADRVLLQSFQ